MQTHVTNVNSNHHIHKFNSNAITQIPNHPYKKEFEAFLHTEKANHRQIDDYKNFHSNLVKFGEIKSSGEMDECFRKLIGQIRLMFPNIFNSEQLKKLQYFATAFGYKSQANALTRAKNLMPTIGTSSTLIEEDKYLSILFYQLAKLVKYSHKTDDKENYINKNQLGEILEKSPELSYMVLYNTNKNLHMLDLLNELTNSKLSREQAVNHLKKGIDKGIRDSTYANIVGFGGAGLFIFLILALSTGAVLGSQTSTLSGFVTAAGTSGSIATGFASGAGIGIVYSILMYNILKSKNFTRLSGNAHDWNQILRVVSPLVMTENEDTNAINSMLERVPTNSSGQEEEDRDETQIPIIKRILEGLPLQRMKNHISGNDSNSQHTDAGNIV